MVVFITFIVSMCIHVFSLSTGANCKLEVTVHIQGGGMLPVALLVHLLGTNTHCCWLNVGALIGKYSKTHGCWILREGCGIRQAAGLVNCMLWMCAFGVQKESTGFVHVQVTLPKGIQPRCQHTATAFSLGPNFRVLVLFGGRRAHVGEPVAETTLLYFGECGYSFIALFTSS